MKYRSLWGVLPTAVGTTKFSYDLHIPTAIRVLSFGEVGRARACGRVDQVPLKIQ
eukprot:SAG11_NODE_1311_length_5234_cov_4.354820_1_plen_55_part_00